MPSARTWTTLQARLEVESSDSDPDLCAHLGTVAHCDVVCAGSSPSCNGVLSVYPMTFQSSQCWLTLNRLLSLLLSRKEEVTVTQWPSLSFTAKTSLFDARHAASSSVPLEHGSAMRSRRLEVASNNQVLDEMRSFQRHRCTPKESDCSLTTVRHSCTLNRSVDRQTETSRSVHDGTTYVLHWVHIHASTTSTLQWFFQVDNQSTKCSPVQTAISRRATTSRSIVSQSIERYN